MRTTISETGVTLLSRKGLRELKKSISQLEFDKKQTLRELHELDKTLGRENRLTRIEKVTELENIEIELNEKQTILANSKLIYRRHKQSKVVIGSIVELADTNGRQYRYTLVNSIEANPSDGRISVLSPIGRNLIGKTVRDIIRWGSGNRIHKLRLVRIV